MIISKSNLRSVFSRVFGITIQDLPETLDIDSIVSWDSLAHLSLIEQIEQEFGVKLTQAEAVTMLSEAEILRVLEKKLQKNKANRF